MQSIANVNIIGKDLWDYFNNRITLAVKSTCTDRGVRGAEPPYPKEKTKQANEIGQW